MQVRLSMFHSKNRWKNMKKFVRNILVFFAVVAVIDVAFGFTCRYLNNHAKGGDTKLYYYIANECEADILIFGSSRAFHHYDPRIIEDSLGLSCYNCGIDGNGVVFLYSRLLMITERYVPKVIVYDICGDFDVYDGDNTKYLKCQKRFYNKPGISDVFELVSPNEKYKMLSQLYRYNGDFIQMLMDNIHPLREFNEGGYRPINQTMAYEPKISDNLEQAILWDQVKYKCMIRFISHCKEKGIKLIFSFSPAYGGNDCSCENLITELSEEYGIPVINNYKDSEFVYNKGFFYDPMHMNEKGVTMFTKKFVSELEEYIKL